MTASLSLRICPARLLGAAIVSALSLAPSVSPARTELPNHVTLRLRPGPHPIGPANPLEPQSHIVTSCEDDGTAGTLRSQVATAQSGDVIDLRMLACSTITLLNGAISVNQASLSMLGKVGDRVVIDAGRQSRAFDHFGAGTLALRNLDVINGYYVGATHPEGGCVYSRGSITLAQSTISHCTLVSSSASISARGGGVFAEHAVYMKSSSINDGNAIAQSGANAMGGGLYAAQQLTMNDAHLIGNTAFANNGGVGFGGGGYVNGSATLSYTTIIQNRAYLDAGIAFTGAAGDTASLSNCTISGNTARAAQAGVGSDVPLSVFNSTIVFNESKYDLSIGGSDGVYSRADLVLQSSIVAGNGGVNGPNDLGGSPQISVSGHDNLVTSTAFVLPPAPVGPIVSTECPKLDVMKHSDITGQNSYAPLADSPAIDLGNDQASLSLDQRFQPRLFGNGVDIGAVERNANDVDERIFTAHFDRLCDF